MAKSQLEGELASDPRILDCPGMAEFFIHLYLLSFAAAHETAEALSGAFHTEQP